MFEAILSGAELAVNPHQPGEIDCGNYSLDTGEDLTARLNDAYRL